MSLPPLVADSDAGDAGWRRRVRDLLNAIARFTMQRGETVARPANPDVGTQYYDKTLQRPVWFDGSQWRDASGVVA